MAIDWAGLTIKEIDFLAVEGTILVISVRGQTERFEFASSTHLTRFLKGWLLGSELARERSRARGNSALANPSDRRPELVC